jgi:chromate transporter
MALQGFGGVLAVVQREMVERRRWMTREGFVEEWAVAQVMPGPNVVNLAIIFGAQHFGWRGSVAGVAGLLCAPTAVVLSLALVYAEFSQIPQVSGALRGMGAVAAGLIAATGLRLLPAVARHPLGWRTAAVFSVLTFLAISVLRMPLATVLLIFGGLSCVLTWRRLGGNPPTSQEDS